MNKEERKEKKKKLIKNISTNTQDIWVGIILAIIGLFVWWPLLVIGIVLSLIFYEIRTKNRQKLIDLE